VYFAPLFLTLGVVGIIYGAVVATNRIDVSSFLGARMFQNDFEHGETNFPKS
jgi:hypothetical protein